MSQTSFYSQVQNNNDRNAPNPNQAGYQQRNTPNPNQPGYQQRNTQNPNQSGYQSRNSQNFRQSNAGFGRQPSVNVIPEEQFDSLADQYIAEDHPEKPDRNKF